MPGFFVFTHGFSAVLETVLRSSTFVVIQGFAAFQNFSLGYSMKRIKTICQSVGTIKITQKKSGPFESFVFSESSS